MIRKRWNQQQLQPRRSLFTTKFKIDLTYSAHEALLYNTGTNPHYRAPNSSISYSQRTNSLRDESHTSVMVIIAAKQSRNCNTKLSTSNDLKLRTPTQLPRTKWKGEIIFTSHQPPTHVAQCQKSICSRRVWETYVRNQQTERGGEGEMGAAELYNLPRGSILWALERAAE